MQDIEDQQFDEYRQRQIDCEHKEKYTEDSGRIFCRNCNKFLGWAFDVTHLTASNSKQCEMINDPRPYKLYRGSRKHGRQA